MRRLLPFAVSTLSMVVLAAPAAAQQVAVTDDASRMHGLHQHDAPVPSGVPTAPRVEVVSDTVSYATIDGKPVRGFRSRPKGAKKDAPALVVVHEWWGLNDNIRAATERLAGEGYVALAVDLYNGSVATTPDSATDFLGLKPESLSFMFFSAGRAGPRMIGMGLA